MAIIDGQGTRASERIRPTRTVAEVDLRSPAPWAGDPERPAVLGMALDELRDTVRPDDRICPYSVSRIAVEFGPDADAVPPGRLGARLARAVGQGLVDRCATGGVDDPVPTKRAERRRPTPAIIPSTTVVTVERTFDRAGNESTRRRPGERRLSPTSAPTAAPRRRQRAVVRYSPDGLGGVARRELRPRGGRTGEAGTVLVLDPDPDAGGEPGLSAVTAASVAERLGFTTGLLALCSDGGLVAEIAGRPLDAVVLVIGPEPPDRVDYRTSTWLVPGRLAAAYRSKGIDVLAVSVGASMAAMAATAEQGARAVYDLHDLRSALSRLGALPVTHRPAAETGTAPPRGAEGLGLLTGAERRVLFSLTTGRAPQAIADDLVVSLATVRTHIRSVLRKLGVRSQLAAVALATSRAAPPAPSHGLPDERDHQVAAPGHVRAR
jgi:DNA-binding CsgD family transcriptional regulator